MTKDFISILTPLRLWEFLFRCGVLIIQQPQEYFQLPTENTPQPLFQIIKK